MTPPMDAALDVECVVAGGDGLARHDSLVVLVPRTLGGERVNARVTVKGRLGRGALLGVERASDARVVPECAHYEGDGCGGCQLQHAAYAEQLRIKSEIVVDALRRIAHREVAPPNVRAADAPWRYRRKLTLALRRDPRGWFAGLRRYDDPDAVFRLDDCRITRPEVLAVWREVMGAADCLPSARDLRGAVRVDDDGSASFALEGGRAWPRANEFFSRTTSLRSLWWTPERGTRRRLAVRENVAQTPDGSFVQVNAEIARALRDHVVTRVRAHAPQHVVDGYAGDGEGAELLAAHGVRVTAIEVDADAAAWASRRLTAPSRVIRGTVEGALQSALPADVVVLNPPRRGVHARVCEIVDAAVARAVVYVSCDPATLARDLSRMPHWRIASLRCFDMFPQTAHVETVCELVSDRAAA